MVAEGGGGDDGDDVRCGRRAGDARGEWWSTGSRDGASRCGGGRGSAGGGGGTGGGGGEASVGACDRAWASFYQTRLCSRRHAAHPPWEVQTLGLGAATRAPGTRPLCEHARRHGTLCPPPPPHRAQRRNTQAKRRTPPLPATLAAPRPTHLGVWGTHERRRGRGGAPVANHRRRRRRLPPRERIAEKGGAPGGLPRRRNPGERWGNNGGRGGAAHCPVPARELPPEGAALRLSGRPTRTA